MALQELDGYDDDYVFLSDIENEPELNSINAVLQSPYNRKQPIVNNTTSTTTVAPASASSRPTSGHHVSLNATASTSGSGSGTGYQTLLHLQQQQQQHAQPNSKRSSRISTTVGTLSTEQGRDDDLDSDPEEIEYGYDTDILLIMPSMLRDYSHHATNYHPELWKAPIPGSYSPPTSAARLRQEDRMLDRQELLKTSIPSTTCGICFESFTPFDLHQQQQQQQQQDEDQQQQPRPHEGHTFANITSEIASQAHFISAFAARLARSFTTQTHALTTHIPDRGATSASASTSPLTSPTEATLSATEAGSSAGGSSSSAVPQEQQQRRPPSQLVQKQRRFSVATTSPSISSRDIGIIMPCDHGLCLSCLQSYLTNATTSPTSRAPTVCPQPGCRTPIPTESAELVLDSQLLEAWYRKLAEIHVANKVCCPRPECQSIVDLDDRDGTAVTCPECKSSFCASCAVPFHRGFTCEEYQNQARGGESEEDRAMLQLVQDRHWRHCPSCRFVIEKQQGCNHMVCHCGQSFCYACGHPWNELDARCSRDCESEGIHEDVGLDCIIM
ncbi:hypothetical protein BGZ83_009356 [Gryganskiella cystojenkinii]|nr:hypothetical protein BGZ83_009356 [Gryganskiella cystojenkinii]